MCSTPIFKQDDKNDVGNYRPLIVVAFLSNYYEGVVFNQLYQYLDTFNLLIFCNFDFRNKISTSVVKVKTLQYIYNDVDSDRAVNYFFQIFLKCVDHIFFTQKKRVWSSRKCVELAPVFFLTLDDDDQISKCRLVDCGVGLGSMIGPLLFLIFINDIPVSYSHLQFLKYFGH